MPVEAVKPAILPMPSISRRVKLGFASIISLIGSEFGSIFLSVIGCQLSVISCQWSVVCGAAVK